MTGLGFDMLKNPGKYFESLRGYSSAPTQSSDLAPTKENAARRAAQTPNTTTSEPKRENKNSFGKTFQISEPRYSGSTDYRNTYNRNFGIPTTSNALTANAAGSFKIVGEDVTEKDYSDFFEGFRSINEDEYAKSIKNNPLAPTIENSIARLQKNNAKVASYKNTSTTESRDAYDARVRKQYQERVQAERDAKYADYDVETAEKRLNDYDYWTGKVIENRKSGNGFSGDYDVLSEREKLEAEIKAAKAAQARNKTRGYESIPGKDDYAFYSSLGDGKVYISELDTPEYLRYATKDELGTYAYIKNKEGEQSANEYIKYLQPMLIARKGTEQGEILAEGGAMMYVPYRTYAGLENYARSIEQMLTDEEVPLTPTAYANRYLSESTKGVGKLAGDVSFGIGNIGPSVAAGMLNPMLGKVSLAASAYGGAYNSALQRGAEKSEARTYATLKTAVDVALQHLLGGISSLGGSKSLSSLTKSLASKMDSAGLRLATQLGGNMFGEGAEEGLQTYIEAGLRNVILDEQQNLRDVSEEALYNSLLGAIEAFIIETPGVVSDMYMADSVNADKAVSGAQITDPESEEAYNFAESYYEEVRHYSTDAQKVSENIGISYEEALRIKNYLFVDNSKYDDESGTWIPFDPNCAIAHSWQRLMIGKDIKPHDRTLILHELYEMEIKRKNKGISHEKAHEMATKKYNYPKESDEYYGSLAKHKEER